MEQGRAAGGAGAASLLALSYRARQKRKSSRLAQAHLAKLPYPIPIAVVGERTGSRVTARPAAARLRRGLEPV